MNTEKITYIQNLINEEVLKLLPEAGLNKGKLGGIKTNYSDDDEDDEGFGIDDLFAGEEPDPSTLRKNVDFSKQPKLRMGRDAYQGAVNAVKGARNWTNATGNDFTKGHQKAFDDLYVNPDIKNKANRYNRDSKNPNVLGRIQVSCTRRQNAATYKAGPIYVITLYNIDPIDVKELALRFEGKGHTEKVNTAATRVNFGKDAVTFIVYEGDNGYNIKDWEEQDLPEILNYLKSSVDDKGKPKYGDDEQFQNLQTTIINRINTQNVQNINSYFDNAEKNSLEKYRTYLESEDDEEISQIIELYSRGGLMDYICKKLNMPDSFGHLLSWRNAKTIMNSGRNATFVLPEAVWLRVFGRVVQPNAQAFYIRIPNVKNGKGKWKNQAPISFPYVDNEGKSQRALLTSTQDILDTFYGNKRYDELSPQQQFFVNCLANMNNPKIKGNYFVIPEYDVADTVWDPNLKPTDVFNETIGLSSNIRRNPELNQAAQDELARRQAELDNEVPEDPDKIQVDTPENTDSRLANIFNLTEEAYNNVKLYAEGEGIKYNEVPNDKSLSLINALMAIANKTFPNIGISNPSLYAPLAKDAVYFACRLEKIALDRVTGLRTKMEKLTEDEVAKFAVVADLLIEVIEGAKNTKQSDTKVALEEDATQLSNWTSRPDVVKSKATKFIMRMCDEWQKENLFEMLNRMDASKKNLL